MIRIAVLLTCHNRKEKTLNCLKHLFSQSGLNNTYQQDVYLVDDGSTDGTGSAVHEAFPSVLIIKGSGTLYWNRGMHTAWKTAAKKKYDFYLWLNDDTELYKQALTELLLSTKKTLDLAIICGCVESPVVKGQLTYGGGRRVKNRYVSNYPDGRLQECEIINGNCVLIPSQVYDLVGNLDWKFSHAIGDNDYALRAKKLGVSTYTTGSFVGSCDQNEFLPKWCLPTTSIRGRFFSLYSPLSYSHPVEYFIYERRHFGMLIALKHYFSIHLRVLAPGLWK